MLPRRAVFGCLAAAGASAAPGRQELPGLELKRKLKVVVVGGHVDDPQSGAGGVLALYANAGHDVLAVSLTRGDSAPIAARLNITPEALAARRRADALKSCTILKSHIMFLNQANQHTHVDPESSLEFAQAVLDERPDVLFTHWPIDTHPDHRAASLLAYSAWLQSGLQFELYYYEVESGHQTQLFQPNYYVDIGSVAAQKHDAVYTNSITVQNAGPWHETMQQFRGMEHGCKYAEAFIHLDSKLVCRSTESQPYWYGGCKFRVD